ncbi:fungal-specific transcription factor domain-containing protein [Chaetomium strumarium]|uniref:Fungal-specific transcription factor domain-containing protein n=1 Tax=Chaetomium strumarium TaxID=1170767 RepID=A0AAJ0H0B5_9PEZI|nr:fungal-specific transcription factor domain-containing protein [Chaetomium strumarium]
MPRALKSASEREMTAVFEAIEYYDLHIAPDLVATGASGPLNPYWMPHAAAPYLSTSCAQSLVCSALCHRVLQSSEAPPSDQFVLVRRLQRHRGEAIRALTADLGLPEQQASDMTLAAVLFLLLVELQYSFEPPDWRHHTNGASAVMQLKGGLTALVLTRPDFHHLLRFYALIEIMGSTTSPYVEPVSSSTQLELISLLPALYGNGMSTCFPCPPDLLAEVIRVNHLRSTFECPESIPVDTLPAAPEEGKQWVALDIIRRVRAFPTSRWACEVVSAIPPDLLESQGGLGGWHSMACIYQSAIAIYCIRALLHDTSELSMDAVRAPGSYAPSQGRLATYEALASARRTCAAVLVSRLREICRYSQLRKMVLWPLVVAGIEAEEDTTKQFVVSELRWISNALGTAAPLVAKDLLVKRVWKLGLGKGTWDTLFDQPYVFVM